MDARISNFIDSQFDGGSLIKTATVKGVKNNTGQYENRSTNEINKVYTIYFNSN